MTDSIPAATNGNGHADTNTFTSSSGKQLRITKKRTRETAGIQDDRDKDLSIPTGHSIADTEERIQKLVLKLAEVSYSDVDQQLATAVELMRDDFTTYSQYIIDHVLHAVYAYPQRIPTYGTLIALINVEHYETVETWIQRVLSDLETTIKHAKYIEARLLVRLITTLTAAHCINTDVLLQFYNKLLQRATQISVNSDTTVGSKRHSNWIIHTVVTALPYIGHQLSAEQYAALSTTVEQLMTARQNDPSLQILRVFKSQPAADEEMETKTEEDTTNKPTSKAADTTEDRLLSLWQAIKQLYERKWEASEVLILPYKAFTNTLLSSKLHPITHSLLTELPTLHAIQPTLLPPDLQLYTNAPELATTPINRLLIQDFISDSLYAYQPLHKLFTRQLTVNIQYMFPTAHLVLEVLISHLFILGTSMEDLPLRMPYIAQIISNIFKQQSQQIPRLFGQLINTLFQRTDDLDVECCDRLALYFSYHLSNFAFAWPWSAWQNVLDDEDTNAHSARRQFVRECLMRLVRLSYWDRVAQSLPEEFIVLMPHQPTPAFRFAEKNALQLPDGQRWLELSQQLLEQLRQRAEPHAVLQWLVDHVTPVLGVQAPLRLLMPCLLEQGNKSFSHINALLDRYHSTLQTLSETDDFAPQIVVHIVGEYWQHSSQHVQIIVNRLQTMQLTDAESISAWCFSQLHTPVAYGTNMWQLMHQAVHHVLVTQPKVQALAVATAAHSTTPTVEAADTDMKEDAPAAGMPKNSAAIFQSSTDIATATEEAMEQFNQLTPNETHADLIVFILLQYRALLTRVHEDTTLQQHITNRFQQFVRTYYRHIELYGEVVDQHVTSEAAPAEEIEEQYDEDVRQKAKAIISEGLMQAIGI